MITLKPVENKQQIISLFNDNSISYNQKSGCVAAKSGEELLGFCLYDLDENQIVIRFITPKSDLPLADGILRSTLHIAAERSIMDAEFENPLDKPFFNALGFIKNSKNNKLDIDKLFQSCSGCKK